MFWNLIFVTVFCTCAFAMYYPSESEEAAYEMQKLLDISNFLTIQDEMDKITAALNENSGLEPQADIAEQLLDKLSPKIYYLLQITKDLASPCREGIYRDGKCVNYIRKDKFVGGDEEDAENLCHAHFGKFAVEDIIDYSDGPYGDSGGGGHYGHDYDGHGGGYYGDAANEGGNYGDAANEGGNYGDAANEGGNYGDASTYGGGGSYGDAPPNEGGYFGEEAHSGGFYGDTASPSLPYPNTDDDDHLPLPPPVKYYVCYEPSVVNVPKNVYFPTKENEEEEEEEAPPGPNPYINPGNDIWFSGKDDPEDDEDECSLFAHHGKVIGKYCVTLYNEPKEWEDAQGSCQARGGTLWEPPGTIAESTVAYALLKEKFGGIVADIELDADPSASRTLFAKIWTGWKKAPLSASPFQSQIGSPPINIGAIIFAPPASKTGFAAAMVQPGTSWVELDPETKLPWACQFNLVKK